MQGRRKKRLRCRRSWDGSALAGETITFTHPNPMSQVKSMVVPGQEHLSWRCAEEEGVEGSGEEGEGEC